MLRATAAILENHVSAAKGNPKGDDEGGNFESDDEAEDMEDEVVTGEEYTE